MPYVSDNYFVIHVTEDGDVRITILTKDELRERCNERYWDDVKFKLVDDRADIQDSPGVYFIKGKSFIPQPKQVTITYEIE